MGLDIHGLVDYRGCRSFGGWVFVMRDHCTAFWAVQDPNMTPTSWVFVIYNEVLPAPNK